MGGTEILVFDIDAAPRGGGQYSVHFKREFVAG
jgi:hypothetical protein